MLAVWNCNMRLECVVGDIVLWVLACVDCNMRLACVDW